MTDWKIDLGVQAEDNITGFKGAVTGRVEYVTGCLQYCLTPRVDDEGKRRDSEWFDENRLLKPDPNPEPSEETLLRTSSAWRGPGETPSRKETPSQQTTPTSSVSDWGPEQDDER